jgi:FMN phosphatase YigB (HAD superfamily)
MFKMPNNISVVGFDLDGTLYPITPEIRKIQRGNIYERMSVHFGISVEESRGLFEKYYGLSGSGKKSMEEISKKLQRPVPGEDFIQESLEQADFLDLLRPNPNLSEMLKRISRTERLDLITGSRYSFALEKLKRISLDKKIFDYIFANEGSKSTGEVYRQWMNKREFSPFQHLYVGDNSMQDIDIPKSLGIQTCFLGSYGEADFQIKDILELEKII